MVRAYFVFSLFMIDFADFVRDGSRIKRRKSFSLLFLSRYLADGYCMCSALLLVKKAAAEAEEV